MIKGIANIIEWIRYNETENWKIRSGQKGEIIFSSPDDKSLTVEDTIVHLQKRLEMLEPGVYYLEAYKHGASNNTWCKTRMVIGESSQAVVNNLPAVSGFTKDQVQEEIQKALSQYQLKTENERLQKENVEFKSKQDDIWFNLSKRLVDFAPYVGAILDRYFPEVKRTQKIAISGLENANHMDENDLARRAEKAVEEWYHLDHDAVLLMEYFVKLRLTNPAIYKKAKEIIMNMFKDGRSSF
jgi:hypothetical protein